MKEKFKKLLSAVSALAVTIAVLPITELPAIAEDEMAEVTNEPTDFSLVEDNSTTEEVISDSDIVVSTFDTPMIMAAQTGVTKEEWIHDLVTAFDMSIEDESTIESHFTDIADSPYAYDIDLAANYGVFDIESESFNPDDLVTREFAAHTANYCFGYLDDGTTVTFTDSDDIYYEYDAIVSVQKGWFKPSSSKFLPNAVLTETEAENILNDAKASLESVVIDENAENTINYTNSVIQLGDSVNASYFNGTVTIKGTSVSIKEGNTFCVNIDGMDKLYKANSVTKDAEGNTIIAVTDASLKDAVSAIDIQGYGDVDYSNAMFYGTSSSSDKVKLLQYKPNINGVQSQLVKAVNIKNDTISIDEEIDMGGASIKLNGTIKNIKPEYKLDYDGVNVNSFYLNVDADADISCTLTGNLIKETSSKEVNLAKVPVALGGSMSANIVISVSVSVSGEITMKYSWDINSGVSYTKAGGWRVTKDFKKKGFSLTASGSEKIAIKAALNAEVFGCKIGEIYVMGGESGKFTNTPRNNGAVFCDNLKVYAFAEAGASLNLFDIVKFSQSYEFIDYNNSPLRYNKHWENGVEVAECSFDKSATSTTSKRTANKASSYSNYSTYGLEYEGIITLVNSADSGGNTLYQTWTESKTLSGNVTVNGDLYLESDVDLDEYTLTVNGNLIQSGGQMKINSGTLNVNGDYTIQNKTHVDPKTKETIQDDNGRICMEWADGTVNVHGDFYMKSNDRCNVNSWENSFRRGTLAIDGNFYQYNNISNNSKSNFQANGITVKFVGSGTHEIYFESDSSYIGDNLEVLDDAKVKISGIFHGFKLAQDIVIDGNTTYDCGDMDLNGYTLTINGDLTQNGGKIQIYGGTLNVNGDYTIQNKTHIDPKTKETIQDDNGRLCMEWADGTVNVHGDFYMKSNDRCNVNSWENSFRRGTLAIDGNFYQYNNISNNSKLNFQSNGITVKFVGSGTHEIYFESDSSYIGDNLEVSDDAKIKISGIFHGFKLAQDIVIDGNTTYNCGDMDLNGYTLTINGDLTQNGGKIQIYGGILNVNGDYTIQNKTHIDPKTKETIQDDNGRLCMEWADGTVNVHGDFYMKSNDRCNVNSWENSFRRGTLAIDRNFYQYNNISTTSKRNFQANGTIVKFVGNGTHKITSESAETQIPDIALTDGATISFNGDFAGFSPVSSCNFSSSETNVAKVTGNMIQAISSGSSKITIEDTSNKSTTINLIVNELVTGDANGDGKLTVADAVILQKWLLAVPNVRLANWEACDLCKDGRIDVFDLCLLKRKLINS